MTDQTITLTAEIVTSYVSNNPVPAAQLPGLIETTHAAVATLGKPPAPPPETFAPAVPVNRSAHDSHLVCLGCGGHFKSLKRHLQAEHGLDPKGYRQRYGLKADYPLVASDYAKARSAHAKSIGLGRPRATMQ